MTELACADVSAQKGYTLRRVQRELKAGTRHVHSLFRDALARRVTAALGAAADAVYLYGSTTENKAGLRSDVDLLVLVNGRRAAAERRLRILNQDLLAQYRNLVFPWVPEMDRMLDYHLITEDDMALRRGYADALTNRYGPYPERIPNPTGE